jgi:hypothetical protein
VPGQTHALPAFCAIWWDVQDSWFGEDAKQFAETSKGGLVARPALGKIDRGASRFCLQKFENCPLQKDFFGYVLRSSNEKSGRSAVRR